MKVVTEQDARQNIAANLRRILTDRGINQTALARMAGENHVAISRVLRGTNTPTVTLLSHIAEALDVSMDRLLSPPPRKNLNKSA
jgi:transcriptional regulator with XRE-family HTH domain